MVYDGAFLRKNPALNAYWQTLILEEPDLTAIKYDHKDTNVYALLTDVMHKSFQRTQADTKPPLENTNLLLTMSLAQLLGVFVLQTRPLDKPAIWHPRFEMAKRKAMAEKLNVHDIMKHLPSEFKTTRLQSKFIYVINRIIDFGNHQKSWSYPLMDPIVKLPKQVNPLGTHRDWQQFLYANELHQHHRQFIQSIQNQTLPKDTRLGVLLIDLMFESFVLDQSMLIALLKQMGHLDNYHYQNGRLYFLASVDDFNEPKRIFIAPQTETLLHQYGDFSGVIALLAINKEKKRGAALKRNSRHRELHELVMRSIKHYVKALHLPTHLLPTSLFGWCRLAQKGLYQTLPPVMIEYYTGAMVSHSLKAQTLEKLFACNTASASINFVLNQQDVDKPTANISFGLKQVRHLFNKKSRKQDAKKLLQQIKAESVMLDDLPTNTRLLRDWGMSQLSLMDETRFVISPLKVLSKLDAIARHVLGVFGEKNLLQIDPLTRSDLYLEVIERAISARNNHTIRSHLRSFNAWLEANHGLIPIPKKDEVFGDPKLTDMTVNANLITFDEYALVKSHLQRLISQNIDDIQERYTLMLLMLILGFRCGLRSTEVFKLKLFDYIDCSVNPQLIIRESYDRELKTTSAKRSFNLVDMLEPDEIEHLRSRFLLVTRRFELYPKNVRKTMYQSVYLFSGHDHLTKTITIEHIKSPLMAMLRRACHDDSLTFHHLRHSFASWYFLSFCIAELDLSIKDYFARFPHTQAWLSQSNARKRRLLPTQEKSRKGAFWIAIKMGHAHFDTSFMHYIHTVDLVSMMIQDQHARRYSAEYWSHISCASANYLIKQKDKREIYASKFLANDTIKTAYKSQLMLFNAKRFEVDTTLPELPKIQALDAAWYQNMATYQRIKTVENDMPLDRDQKVIARLFKKNPRYRLRPLLKIELEGFNRLAEQASQMFDVDLNEPSAYPKEMKQYIRLFEKALTPESAAQDTLKPQRAYQLLVNDPKGAMNIIKMIEKFGIDYQLHLQIKRPKTASDKQKNYDAWGFWAEQLNMKKSKFTISPTYSSSTGAHGRIEIRPITAKGKKHHPFFYFWVCLCAH